VQVDLSDKDSILAASKAVDSYQLVERATASRTTYQNIDTNTSVRDQFRRGDYEYFRSSESIPKRHHHIIEACMNAYRKVGLIRNIIDLMADFGSEGVELVHPNPRIQKFYRGWFKRVRGPERTERFLNMLYRCGNVIVNRSMAKIDLQNERRIRAIGADKVVDPDIEADPDLRPTVRNIPYRYIFLNPLTLEVLGEDISQFVGKQMYAIKISNKLRRAASSPRNDYERELIKALPRDLRTAILKGQREFPLDPNRVSAFFYKKDDWSPWADPLIFAILDDLILLEKAKLSDLAALDGAISQVRLWKLGDLERGIFPTDVAVNKLAEILLSNPGGGAFDLIWGPELTLEESGTEVHQFLGNTKYEPILNSIYAGLGVPPTLTGAATASGMTNNYISLKTLIQRLEYGRAIVKMFWQQEIDLVRKAMGFQRPATLQFSYMALSDEAAEKALLIDLVDRDILSIDTVIERFGEIPELEMLKRRRETRLRENDLLNEKAGPYHTANQIHERIVAALNRGFLTPEQGGIEIPVEFAKDKPPFKEQLDAQIKARQMQGGSAPKPKKKGTPGAGRPKNSGISSPDKYGKRKAAAEETVDFLSLMVWAKEAQHVIAILMNPGILQHFGKQSLRQLTVEEMTQAERVKFRVLSLLEPFSPVTAEAVFPIVSAKLSLDPRTHGVFQQFRSHVMDKTGREPTLEEIRLIQASTYAVMHLPGRARSSVTGHGKSESEALDDATRQARDAHKSISILSTRFSRVAGGWICVVTYEYDQ
jgi:hypothetical protein